MTAALPAARPTVLTVVHAPACHFCDDAMQALAAVAAEFPVSIDTVAAAQPRGQALVRQHRAPMYPLVLVDGQFFSAGRLPRGKLRRVLAGRAAAVVS